MVKSRSLQLRDGKAYFKEFRSEKLDVSEETFELAKD